METQVLNENQKKLAKAINILTNCITLCEIKKENPSTSKIQEMYTTEMAPEEKKLPAPIQSKESTEQNVFGWYKKFIDAKEKEITTGLKSYKSTYNHFKNCFKGTNLSFKDLNKENMDIFKNYLKQQNLVGTTIHKQFRNFKIFIGWVEDMDEDKNEIMIPRAVRKTKVKARYGAPIGLTQDELMQWYNFNLNDRPELKRTRDIFVFAVSIGGPRHGDIQKIGRLLRENSDEIRKKGFNYFEGKTGNSHLEIELNEFGKAILEEYNFEFPHVPCNQRFNKNLKAIAELLKWNQLKDLPKFDANGRIISVERKPLKKIISSKFIRKTGISMDALLGVPIQIGMKRSGHSTYNSYKRYLDIDKKGMQAANNLWDKVYREAKPIFKNLQDGD